MITTYTVSFEQKLEIHIDKIYEDPLMSWRIIWYIVKRCALKDFTNVEDFSLRYPSEEFVYIVWDGELYKIGYTTDPVGRFKALRSSIGREIKVVLCRDFVSGRLVEKALHRRYNQFRKWGEWFELTPELLINLVYDMETLWNYEKFRCHDFEQVDLGMKQLLFGEIDE